MNTRRIRRSGFNRARRRIVHCTIATGASEREIQDDVNNLVSEGFEPFGSVAIAIGHYDDGILERGKQTDHLFALAMVKYEEPEPYPTSEGEVTP